MLRLVKAFLKAGVLTEGGGREETFTGTPQGGILSPLLANIALSALDEHVMEPWEPGGCPPEAGGHIIVSTATRTGASSATRMTSSSWSTAAVMTSPVCARTSPTYCTLSD